MKLHCRIELEFATEKIAANICKAVELDDGDYIESRVEGNKLVAVASSNSLLGLRSTVDDYLAWGAGICRVLAGRLPGLRKCCSEKHRKFRLIYNF